MTLHGIVEKGSEVIERAALFHTAIVSSKMAYDTNTTKQLPPTTFRKRYDQWSDVSKKDGGATAQVG